MAVSLVTFFPSSSIPHPPCLLKVYSLLKNSRGTWASLASSSSIPYLKPQTLALPPPLPNQRPAREARSSPEEGFMKEGCDLETRHRFTTYPSQSSMKIHSFRTSRMHYYVNIGNIHVMFVRMQKIATLRIHFTASYYYYYYFVFYSMRTF